MDVEENVLPFGLPRVVPLLLPLLWVDVCDAAGDGMLSPSAVELTPYPANAGDTAASDAAAGMLKHMAACRVLMLVSL